MNAPIRTPLSKKLDFAPDPPLWLDGARRAKDDELLRLGCPEVLPVTEDASHNGRHVTLIVTAFLIAAINPAVSGNGSYKLGTSGEPILDGFRGRWSRPRAREHGVGVVGPAQGA